MSCLPQSAQSAAIAMLGLQGLAGIAAISIGSVGLATSVHAASAFAEGSFAGNIAVGCLCIIGVVFGVLGTVRRNASTSYWFAFLVIALFALVGEAVIAVTSIISLVNFNNDPYGFAYVVWYHMSREEGHAFEVSHNCTGFDGCKYAVVDVIRAVDIAVIAISWFVVLVLIGQIGLTCYATHNKPKQVGPGIRAPSMSLSQQGNMTMTSLGSATLVSRAASDPSSTLSGLSSYYIRPKPSIGDDQHIYPIQIQAPVRKNSVVRVPTDGTIGAGSLSRAPRPAKIVTGSQTVPSALPYSVAWQQQQPAPQPTVVAVAGPTGLSGSSTMPAGMAYLPAGTIMEATVPPGSGNASFPMDNIQVQQRAFPANALPKNYYAPSAAAAAAAATIGTAPGAMPGAYAWDSIPEEPSHEDEEECITWGSPESMSRQAQVLVERAASNGTQIA